MGRTEAGTQMTEITHFPVMCVFGLSRISSNTFCVLLLLVAISACANSSNNQSATGAPCLHPLEQIPGYGNFAQTIAAVRSHCSEPNAGGRSGHCLDGHAFVVVYGSDGDFHYFFDGAGKPIGGSIGSDYANSKCSADVFGDVPPNCNVNLPKDSSEICV